MPLVQRRNNRHRSLPPIKVGKAAGKAQRKAVFDGITRMQPRLLVLNIYFYGEHSERELGSIKPEFSLYFYRDSVEGEQLHGRAEDEQAVGIRD